MNADRARRLGQILERFSSRSRQGPTKLKRELPIRDVDFWNRSG
jgi:hypothetical protein